MDSVENWESLSEPVAWRPTEEYLQKSRLLRFMRHHDIPDYATLQERAASDPAWFWDAVSKDLELVWQRPYTQVLDTSRGIAWSTWFIGGQFNYVATALDQHAGSARAEQNAVIWEGEDGEVRSLTYSELFQLTNRVANALTELGVGRGDRVAIYMPMVPETVAATLACGKIGAIFMPVFSGYGAEAVATRLQDSEAKVIITADGYYRRGKVVAMKEIADAAAGGISIGAASRRRAPDGECGALYPWSRHLVARSRPEAAGHLPNSGDRSRRTLHAHLYVRNHRQTQRGRTCPRGLSYQRSAGHGASV